jgi:hypothetical protein
MRQDPCEGRRSILGWNHNQTMLGLRVKTNIKAGKDPQPARGPSTEPS